jgi:TolA-binding protein
MTDDPASRVLRIRYDQIIQLHERISRLEDRIAAIQYTNLRRDMNAENRAKTIDALCKEEKADAQENDRI